MLNVTTEGNEEEEKQPRVPVTENINDEITALEVEAAIETVRQRGLTVYQMRYKKQEVW